MRFWTVFFMIGLELISNAPKADEFGETLKGITHQIEMLSK